MRSASRILLLALLGIVLVPAHSPAQVFTWTPEEMVKYTAQNPYERFPDGRPKVPDSILERVKGLSAEEVLGIARFGFKYQYASGFYVNRPGTKLVGRAFTLMLMPYRPDIEAADTAERKANGLP